MRITFVNRMMGILRGGGEHFDLNMARALRALGADVRFCVGRRRAKIDEPLPEFPTEYLTTPYLRNIEYRYKEHPWRIMRSASYRSRLIDNRLFINRAFRHLRRDIGTDIYQVCNLPRLGAMLAETGRRAVIRWPGPPSRESAAFAARCAGCFSHGKSYEQSRQYLPETQHIVAGCDTELFHPPDQRNAAPGKCRFLFVGRCVSVKNLDVLIDAFAVVNQLRPETRLTIVGEGELRPALMDKARALDMADVIAFPGFLAGPELAEQYRQADCFVLLSQYESFSLVALEAMSSGLPLVLADVGHLPFFVNELKAGVLVEPNDASAASEAMIALADDADRREEIGQWNHETVKKRYSWTASARKLLAFYESILAGDTVAQM